MPVERQASESGREMMQCPLIRADGVNLKRLVVGAVEPFGESASCENPAIAKRYERRIPASVGHLAGKGPALALWVKHRGIPAATVRIVTQRAARGQQSTVGQERIAAAEQTERPIIRCDQRMWMEKIVRRLSGRIPDDAHVYTLGNVAEVGTGKTVKTASGTGKQQDFAVRQQRRMHSYNAGMKRLNIPLSIPLRILIQGQNPIVTRVLTRRIIDHHDDHRELAIAHHGGNPAPLILPGEPCRYS